MSIMALLFISSRRWRLTESGGAAFRSGSEEAVPQGIDDLAQERAMALHFLRRCHMRPRRTGNPDGLSCRCSNRFGTRRVGDQAQSDLPPAGQLDIDLGEQLGIEQRAMLDALRPVDPKPGAQRIETV